MKQNHLWVQKPGSGHRLDAAVRRVEDVPDHIEVRWPDGTTQTLPVSRGARLNFTR